jgi:hypothetical protein
LTQFVESFSEMKEDLTPAVVSTDDDLAALSEEQLNNLSEKEGMNSMEEKKEI